MSSKLPVVPLVRSHAWCRCLRLMATWLVAGTVTLTFPAWTTEFSATNNPALELDWIDNAVDESQYLLMRRQGFEAAYQPLTVLPADSTGYTDAAVNGGEIYCYQVIAVNEHGESPPAENCAIAPPLDDDLTGWGEIAAKVVMRPGTVDMAGREYLTLNALASGNEEASAAAIHLPVFEVNIGEESRVDEYHFVDEGVAIDSGLRQVPFDEFNAIGVTLEGSGQWQTATLLMRAGAWQTESAGMTVTAGGNSLVLPLPVTGDWQYFEIQVRFAETVDVVVRPNNSNVVEGALGLAAIMIDEVDDGSVDPWATISTTLNHARTVLDVTELEYVTGHRNIHGNTELSPAEIGVPVWSVAFGEMKSRFNSRFTFLDEGIEVDTGFTKMRFDQANTLDVPLSGDGQARVALFYLAVKAWHRQPVSFTVTAAQAEQQVALPTSFGWHYFKIRVVFKGELTVRFRPNGHLNKYSTLGLGGVVVEP